MSLDPEPIRDILLRTTARYLTVRPSGVLIGTETRPSLDVRVLAHGGARTLYRGRKPHCRSLDAVRSLDGQTCPGCYDLKHCTPQVRVDLLADNMPYRLLLAYTSAKHFLLYEAALRQSGVDIATVQTRITVADRGSWGEMRFHRV